MNKLAAATKGSSSRSLMAWSLREKENNIKITTMVCAGKRAENVRAAFPKQPYIGNGKSRTKLTRLQQFTWECGLYKVAKLQNTIVYVQYKMLDTGGRQARHQQFQVA